MNTVALLSITQFLCNIVAKVTSVQGIRTEEHEPYLCMSHVGKKATAPVLKFLPRLSHLTFPKSL